MKKPTISSRLTVRHGIRLSAVTMRVISAVTLALAAPSAVTTLAVDDTVVDPAADEDQTVRRRPRVKIDDQIRGIVSGLYGGPDKMRQHFLEAGRVWMATLQDVCELTDAQRETCETAIRLGVEHMVDEIEGLSADYAGRSYDPDNLSSPERRECDQACRAVAEKLQTANVVQDSLETVLPEVLSADQWKRWQAEMLARERYYWAAFIDLGFVPIELQLGLTSSQAERLRDLVLERPMKVDWQKIRRHPHNEMFFATAACRLCMRDIGEQRLREIVSDRQWRTLAVGIKQTEAAMLQWQKHGQGVFLK